MLIPSDLLPVFLYFLLAGSNGVQIFLECWFCILFVQFRILLAHIQIGSIDRAFLVVDHAVQADGIRRGFCLFHDCMGGVCNGLSELIKK